MTGILSLTTFAPLLGVAAILMLRVFGKGDEARASNAARWIALATTLNEHVSGCVVPVASTVLHIQAEFIGCNVG